MVPSDLDDHYESRRVNFSLRTKSIRTARQSASSVSLKLEGYWQYLRLNETSLPGSNLIRTNSSNSTTSPTHPFSDAVQLYLDLKGLNKAKTFRSAANRACIGKALERSRARARNKSRPHTVNKEYLLSIFPSNYKCRVFGIDMSWLGNRNNSPSNERHLFRIALAELKFER